MHVPLGRMFITPGALNILTAEDISRALTKHATGDWGELCSDDKRLNDEAAFNQSRILSAYASTSGTKFWIITEWDRSVTTVLLPEEY